MYHSLYISNYYLGPIPIPHSDIGTPFLVVLPNVLLEQRDERSVCLHAVVGHLIGYNDSYTKFCPSYRHIEPFRCLKFSFVSVLQVLENRLCWE